MLIVAALGWLFDCLDQQLFVLARPAAMRDLLPPQTDPRSVRSRLARQYGGYATSIFLVGWALGGVVFGVLGDRWGRAKVMMITILMYSAVHRAQRDLAGLLGLCALSISDRAWASAASLPSASRWWPR